MIEKSSRKYVAIFAILILFTTPLLANYHPAFATASTGIMIPLYSYPGTYWTQVLQAKNAHPSVPIAVIINPNNGPGSSIDSNYVTGIQQMQAAGITVLGYVYTSYGARSTSSIEADINTYNTWYHVNGINFDEMSNVAGFETYYSNLSSYAKSLGMTMTVGNPGTDTLSSYIGTVDVLDIYENPGLPILSDLTGWHTSYPKSNFAFIGFGVSSLPSQSTITTDSGYVGYMYITDDTLPNPYDTVPSYLSTEVGMLDTGSTSTVPGSPTGLTATATSSSQINLGWTASSNNGGSVITGYKIERSTDGGTSWSTVTSNTSSTSTTYSDTGLTASTTYTYRVSAINAVGTSSPSSTASATTGSTATSPQPPTGLTATDISSSQINLSWTAPTNNGNSAIVGYKIERSSDGGTTWSSVQSNTGTTGTTYSDSGLVASTSYTYRVSAINSVGTSTPSSTASATTSSGTTTTVPSSPTSLTANTISSSQINLSWTAPSNNGGSAITGYKIERSTDGGTTWSTIQSNTGSTSTTYSDTGLAASTAYTYRVSAINSVGTSIPSNIASSTTQSITSITSTLAVATQDSSGNAITGLYITLSQGGTTVATGYSPTTFTLNNNVQYLIQAYGYHTHVFDHWKDNGSTTNPRPITITTNTQLTAVYRTPTISLSPSTGPAGTTVIVTGTNFSSSSTATISFDNNALSTNPTTIMTDSSGAFKATFTVPSSTTGTHTVTAKDALSHPASAQFTVSSTSNPIILNGIQKTSGTVSSSPYQITLSSFNAGTGTNRLLVVGVEANNNAVASVTFGGVQLTRSAHSFSNNDAEFWYLKNPSGTGNIVVTMTGSTSVVVGAYSFSGVDQTTPLPTSATNHNTASSSPTVSITTQYSNSWILDSPSIYGGVTLGSPTCTQQWDIHIASAVTGASSSTAKSSAGLATCSWTASGGGDLWDDVAIEIKASG